MNGRKRRIIVAAVVGLAVGVVALIAYQSRSPYAFLNAFHPRRVSIHWPWSLPDGPAKNDPTRTMLVFPAAEAPTILAALKNELVDGRGFDMKEEERVQGYWVLDPPNSKSDESEIVFNAGDQAGYEADRFENNGADPEEPSPPSCYVILPPHPGAWFDGLWGRVMGWFH